MGGPRPPSPPIPHSLVSILVCIKEKNTLIIESEALILGFEMICFSTQNNNQNTMYMIFIQANM